MFSVRRGPGSSSVSARCADATLHNPVHADLAMATAAPLLERVGNPGQREGQVGSVCNGPGVLGTLAAPAAACCMDGWTEGRGGEWDGLDCRIGWTRIKSMGCGTPTRKPTSLALFRRVSQAKLRGHGPILSLDSVVALLKGGG